MLESFLVALFGELVKALIANLPALVAGVEQTAQNTLTDSPASDSSGTVTELTNAVDQAIAAGTVPPP
jgi:hypothetical protein